MIIFNGKTHVVISISLFLILKDYFSFNKPVGFILFFLVIASIIADIDHPGSLFGRWIYPISSVTEHRNEYTHSPAAAFIFSLPLLAYDIVYFSVFFTVYLFHLLVDFLTPTGIPLLFPFSKEKYSLNLVKNGSVEEIFILSAGLLYIFKTKF